LLSAACGGKTEDGATGAPNGGAGANGTGAGGIAAPGCPGAGGKGEVPYFQTGYGAVSLSVGDFNSDGKADVAVANRDSNAASVLLGNGDGIFAPRVDYATATAPSSVVAGDFNLDGRLDLTLSSARAPGSVSVLLGNGDGTFAPRVDYATSDFPASLAVEDFNSDGEPDLALANLPLDSRPPNAVSITVTVLLGNGDGSFRLNVEYTIDPPTSGPTSVAAGDFNVDGNPDLAVPVRDSNGVAVLLGNGDGTFADVVGYTTGMSPSWVVVADFNLDGNPDLAVAGGAVSVLLGNGDGTFAHGVEYSVGGEVRPVAVGDFNLDSKPDLAVANSTINGPSKVSLLLGNGDGTFGSGEEYEMLPSWDLSLTSVATGDFDLDGKPDIAATDYFAGILVLLGRCL
jgi:hypothetical protein